MRERVFGLLLLTGCADGGPTVGWVPELPGDVSLVAVMLLDESGRVIEASGLVAAEEARNLVFTSAADDASEILLVSYDDLILSPARRPSADVLGAAPLHFATELEARLPSPRFAARGPYVVDSTLTPANAVPALSANWVSPCARTACERFRFASPRSVVVPGEYSDLLRTTLPSSDRKSVLLATNTAPGSVHRFREPGVVERVTEPIAGARPRSFAQRLDGQIMLLFQDGKLWTGPPEGPLSLQVDATLPAEMTNLATATHGDALEVYAQDENASLYALEGDAWRPMVDISEARSTNQEVAWLGASTMLVLADEGDRVVYVVDERVVSERAFRNGRVILTLEGLGPIISGGQALSNFEPGVYRWTPSSLELLPLPKTSRAPEGLWAGPGFGEFFYGGANGELHVSAGALGACQLPAWSGEAIRSVTWMSEGLLLGPRRPDAQLTETEVLYVPFAEPPISSCEDAYREISR